MTNHRTCMHCSRLYVVRSTAKECPPCHAAKRRRNWRKQHGLPQEFDARACDTCAATFVPIRQRQRFCSDQCRHQRAKSLHLFRCAACDRVTSTVGRPRRFCSSRCKDAWRNQRRDRSTRTWAKVCRCCGDGFRAPSSSQRYCSATCREQARPPRPRQAPRSDLRWSECGWCGHWFINRTGRVACSITCRSYLRRLRKGALASPVQYRDCIECGRLACVPGYWPDSPFCSQTCSRRAAKRDRAHLIRSLSRSGDRITINALGERDGWRCHICRKKVTKKHGHTGPSPTIDHLIPVNKRDGGTHTWDNVALAHLRCNGKRSDTGDAQLRLIA